MFCMHAVPCLSRPMLRMRVLLLPLGVTIMGGEPSRRCGFQPMHIGWCPVGHYMAPQVYYLGAMNLLWRLISVHSVSILFFGPPLRWAQFGKCAPTLNIF